jgi:DnaJ-class molecular chaperone
MRCGGEGTIEKRFPVPVRIPPGVREGTVFQVTVDDPSVVSVLLTVHIRGI